MAGDYIPHSEPRLVDWANRFVEYAAAHAADLGMTPDELQEFTAQHEEFNDRYAEHRNAQVAAAMACRRKDDARSAFVKHMRSVAMRMQVAPGIPPADKYALGLSTGEPRQHARPGLSGNVPVVKVDFDQPQMHVLHISSLTPAGPRLTKPTGAVGCEVYRKVGGDHAGFDEMEIAGFAMKNQLAIGYRSADVGKRVYYAARWVDRNGNKGPWSDIRTAIIA